MCMSSDEAEYNSICLSSLVWFNLSNNNQSNFNSFDQYYLTIKLSPSLFPKKIEECHFVLVKCPEYNGSVNYDNLFKSFFGLKRYIELNDLIAIDTCAYPQIYNEYQMKSSVKQSFIFFKCTNLDQLDRGIIDQTETRVYLTGTRNSHIPRDLYYSNLHSFDQFVKYDKSTIGHRTMLSNYFNQLKQIVRPYLKIRSLLNFILLTGEIGSGVEYLIDELACQLRMNLIEFDADDFLNESLTINETKLQTNFQLITLYSPCILVLKNVDILIKSLEGNELRFIELISSAIEVERRSVNSPVLMIATSSTMNCDQVNENSEFSKLFTQQLHIDDLRLEERSEILQTISVKNELCQSLGPVQCGFGIKGGAEAIVHSTRTFVSADHNIPMAIVKFDYKNAFNMMFRKFLLSEVKTESPALFPMLQQAYRCPSYLYYNDEIILSKRGVQQGDPAGPAAFCIGMKKLTHSLLSRLNSWFLDDGNIGDKLSIILEDIKKVIAFYVESGMVLNSDKCEVYFINASETIENEMFAEINALLPGIKRLDSSSFDLLGAPILEDGITRMLSSKFEEMKIFCNRLNLLDVHPALSIFRSSLSSPKFQYLLRTSPTFEDPNLLSEIDEFFRSTLESITNNQIDEISWKQASLPLRFSGLGLRKLTELAYPSYFSSVYQSLELSNKLLAKFDLTILDESFKTKILNYPANFIPNDEALKIAQTSWDELRTVTTFNELLESSEPIDRARILASSTKTSSKWLQAIPSPQLGLLLDNNAARIAVALRLGCKVCERHKCVCGVMVKENGHHGLSCRKSAGRFGRHCEINKIVSMAFTSAGFPNIREPPGLSRIDGKRPDGLTLIPWSNGKGLLWDATVVDTLAPSYISLSSKNAGSVADKAERHKHNTYIDLKLDNHTFTPLAFETFGSIGPETSNFLSFLGRKLSQATFEPRSLNYLLERLSIAIQRYNAVCVLGTFDKHEIKLFNNQFTSPSIDLELLAKEANGLNFTNLINLFKKALSQSTNCETLTTDQLIEVLSKYKKNLKTKNHLPDIPNVNWSDVGGLADAKKEIFFTIQLTLKYGKHLNNKLKRSGILFYGPPGTGKTLLAKAIATEFKLNFLSVKGPEIMNMYIGQSEENIRNIFTKARTVAPSIVFFDELDSIARKRGKNNSSSGVMDRLVSTLLTELDCIHDAEQEDNELKPVFVIGATNRPDLLDPALLRYGRFDKMVFIGLDNSKEQRLSILRAITRKFNFNSDCTLELVESECPQNMTGADFYGLCSNAHLNALKRQIHILESKDNDGDQEETDKDRLSDNERIEVNLEDFLQAIRTMRVSISEDELRKYAQLSEAFTCK